MTTRRAFLAGLAIAGLPKLTWADAGAPRYVLAGMAGAEGVIHGLDAAGQSLFALPLPARGHAATLHPTRPWAVAFARRPGTYAVVLDCATGQAVDHLTPPEGRQFCGHGAFGADGSILFTAEVVAEGSAGRVGVWDTRDFTRIGEWDTRGIGPHEIRLRPDGTIVVANGGIQTDPSDRTKLNIDTMRPNLTLLSATGEVLAQAELAPELWKNSIRHIALTPKGDVAFAMQWEGDAAVSVPLIGLWRPGLAPLLALPDETFAMKGYAGSIAATADRIAITSPKGGRVQIFDPDLTLLAQHSRADLCGLAATPEGRAFFLSDGSGRTWRADDQALTPLAQTPVAWDNHILRL